MIVFVAVRGSHVVCGNHTQTPIRTNHPPLKKGGWHFLMKKTLKGVLATVLSGGLLHMHSCIHTLTQKEEEEEKNAPNFQRSSLT